MTSEGQRPPGGGVRLPRRWPWMLAVLVAVVVAIVLTIVSVTTESTGATSGVAAWLAVLAFLGGLGALSQMIAEEGVRDGIVLIGPATAAHATEQLPPALVDRLVEQAEQARRYMIVTELLMIGCDGTINRRLRAALRSEGVGDRLPEELDATIREVAVMRRRALGGAR